MAKVDVLIPTYNRAGLLHQAVQSILNQSFKDFRVVIYDDGSTDGSTDEDRIPQDSRIVVLNRGGSQNHGIPYARNRLLEALRAPFACWQDSDDIAAHKRLELMLGFLERTSVDVAMSYLNFFTGALNRKRYYPYRVDTSRYAVPDKEGNPKNYGLDNNMTFATAFFKSELRCFPFDETKVIAEDHEWFRSMLRAGKTFGTLPEFTYYARRHDGRITYQVRNGLVKRT